MDTHLHSHKEQHFTASETVRDIVIGMSDGLTVPFALAAGLTGAIGKTSIIVTAGLAEIAAGSIAMGLGGYLAARGDAEHYQSELRREQQECVEKPEAEVAEVREILIQYGLAPDDSQRVAEAMKERPKEWVDFMMRFELGLEEPDPKRAYKSALTIAASYVVGGMIPLLPYMLVSVAREGFVWSVCLTLAALVLFGFIKGRFSGVRPGRSALQTVVIGGLAAAAAYAIARAIA